MGVVGATFYYILPGLHHLSNYICDPTKLVLAYGIITLLGVCNDNTIYR
jgi:hypothetical protein